MSTLSILPHHYDTDFILNKMKAAGINNHYGYESQLDGIHLVYPATHYDTVQAILDAYPVEYADEVLRPRMKDEVTALRWEKQQIVPNWDGNGGQIPSDDITIGRVIAALDLMDRNPDLPRERNWKVSDGVWATLHYDAINAMGRAIGVHVQACFDREEALHTALDTAADISDLAAIDVNAGWPE